MTDLIRFTLPVPLQLGYPYFAAGIGEFAETTNNMGASFHFGSTSEPLAPWLPGGMHVLPKYCTDQIIELAYLSNVWQTLLGGVPPFASGSAGVGGSGVIALGR